MYWQQASLTCQYVFRWLAAVKVSHGANKDMLAAAAKAETLKEEYEEQTAKFESCQVSGQVSGQQCYMYL